ncbi:MAG: SDR family oxidoreductase [Actinomycetota bacterium]|nr:SDR family oxidoreductase [Actinomycetota bacterium]
MRVVIAGGHGQIALLIEELLAGRGDEPVGLIRDPAQGDDLRHVGATPVVFDLEHSTADELVTHLDGADAVVFAAGAGPGSGAARKETVDRDGAVLLADAAEAAGVRRYVLISSVGAGTEPDEAAVGATFAAYLRAKTAAEESVRPRTGLDVTIVRPGRLTDDPPIGTVELGPDVARGDITRADTAAVVVGALDRPASAGATFTVIGGDVPIGEALDAICS